MECHVIVSHVSVGTELEFVEFRGYLYCCVGSCVKKAHFSPSFHDADIRDARTQVMTYLFD